MALKEGNVDADIESGQTPLKTDNHVSVCNGLSKSDGSKSGDHTCESVQVVIEKNPGTEFRDLLAFAEKGYLKEKRSNPYSNKHPKPPRPPKGPLLNASDMKLVREISEIAVLKRARIERIKALKKMKAAKGSSTSGNVTAVVITVLFFIVVVLQGVYSRGGILVGSPEPSVANKGLINMQFYSKPPANEINGPIYRYPNLQEAPSVSGPHMEDGRKVQ